MSYTPPVVTPAGTASPAPPDPTRGPNQLWASGFAHVSAQAVGCLGDSLTASLIQTGSSAVYTVASPTAPGTMATALTTATDTISAINQGVGGTKVGDWAPGSAIYIAAVAAFHAAGVKYVNLTLGTNDALAAESAATFASGLTALVDGLVQDGFVPILNYPPATTDSTVNTALVSYHAKIDALVNGTTVLAGDTSAYAYYLANPGNLGADGVHLTQAGYNHLGGLWATALVAPLLAASGAQSRAGLAIGSALGVSNGALIAYSGLLVEDGASAPPVSLTNEAQDDWLSEG